MSNLDQNEDENLTRKIKVEILQQTIKSFNLSLRGSRLKYNRSLYKSDVAEILGNFVVSTAASCIVNFGEEVPSDEKEIKEKISNDASVREFLKLLIASLTRYVEGDLEYSVGKMEINSDTIN